MWKIALKTEEKNFNPLLYLISLFLVLCVFSLYFMVQLPIFLFCLPFMTTRWQHRGSELWPSCVVCMWAPFITSWGRIPSGRLSPPLVLLRASICPGTLSPWNTRYALSSGSQPFTPWPASSLNQFYNHTHTFFLFVHKNIWRAH